MGASIYYPNGTSVTSGTQTFAGAKTFSSAITCSAGGSLFGPGSTNTASSTRTFEVAGTTTSTTNRRSGTQSIMTATPAGASSASILGGFFRAIQTAQNNTGIVAGVSSDAQNTGAGTATRLASYHALPAQNTGGGAVTTASGLYVEARGAGTNRWGIEVVTDPIAVDGGYYIGTTGPRWLSGSGSPEGAVTAPVGSLYSRTDGGASTSLYVKESGIGNTGWVGK